MKKLLKRIKFNFFIDPDQLDKLNAIATREVSIAEHLRRAVAQYLEGLKDK